MHRWFEANVKIARVPVQASVQIIRFLVLFFNISFILFKLCKVYFTKIYKYIKMSSFIYIFYKFNKKRTRVIPENYSVILPYEKN